MIAITNEHHKMGYTMKRITNLLNLPDNLLWLSAWKVNLIHNLQEEVEFVCFKLWYTYQIVEQEEKNTLHYCFLNCHESDSSNYQTLNDIIILS